MGLYNRKIIRITSLFHNCSPMQTSVCNGGSLLYAFNPMTGHGVSPKPTCLPEVLQTLLLPVHDHTHSKILLILTKNLKVHVNIDPVPIFW